MIKSVRLQRLSGVIVVFETIVINDIEWVSQHSKGMRFGSHYDKHFLLSLLWDHTKSSVRTQDMRLVETEDMRLVESQDMLLPSTEDMCCVES